MTPIFSRSWLMKMAMVCDRARLPVSLRSAWLIRRAWRPTCGEPADPQRHVEGQRPRRDHVDLHVGVLAQAHDRTLAELLLDLTERHLEGLVMLHWNPSWVVCHLVPGGSRQVQRTYGV